MALLLLRREARTLTAAPDGLSPGMGQSHQKASPLNKERTQFQQFHLKIDMGKP